MKITKINDHIGLNFLAYKKAITSLRQKDQDVSFSRDEERRIQTMKNKAEGYVARFGDKTMLKKELSLNSDTHQFLLLNMGMAIDKKEAISKTLNSSVISKNSELLDLVLRKEEAEKEMKSWMLQIDDYYLKERFSNPVISSNIGYAERAETEIPYVKKKVAFGEMLNPSVNELKVNVSFLNKLLLDVEALNAKPLNNSVDYGRNDDVEVQFFEDTAEYEIFLNEDRVEKEMAAISLKNMERDGIVLESQPNKVNQLPTMKPDFKDKKPTIEKSKNKDRPANQNLVHGLPQELSLEDVQNIMTSIDDKFDLLTIGTRSKIEDNSEVESPISMGEVGITTKDYNPSNLVLKKPTAEKIQDVIKNVKAFEDTSLGKKKSREVSKMFIFGVKRKSFTDMDTSDMISVKGIKSKKIDLANEEIISDPLSGRILLDRIIDTNGNYRKREDVKFRY